MRHESMSSTQGPCSEKDVLQPHACDHTLDADHLVDLDELFLPPPRFFVSLLLHHLIDRMRLRIRLRIRYGCWATVGWD